VRGIELMARSSLASAVVADDIASAPTSAPFRASPIQNCLRMPCRPIGSFSLAILFPVKRRVNCSADPSAKICGIVNAVHVAHDC